MKIRIYLCYRICFLFRILLPSRYARHLPPRGRQQNIALYCVGIKTKHDLQLIGKVTFSVPSSDEERRKRHKRLTAICWEVPKAQGGECVTMDTHT